MRFTSHPRWPAACRSYRRRWAIEGTYRDAPGGWDGHQGWHLEARVRRLASADQVERLVGLWARGTVLQTWLGSQIGAPTAPEAVRQVLAERTTTGRLSVWARGRLALTDPSGRRHAWVPATIAASAARLAPIPPVERRALLGQLEVA